VSCEDYPETASTGTPAANAQGPGNVALGGCGNATNTDACRASVGHSTLQDINGVDVPELDTSGNPVP